jgi:AcrR family transcriptional regulator
MILELRNWGIGKTPDKRETRTEARGELLGIAERKERERVERKTLIIRCAKECILEKGMEGVSMGEIAARAELSKATLYLYFSGKEEIFAEILNANGSRFIEYVRSQTPAGTDALEAIRILWKSFITIFGESEEMGLLFRIWNYLSPAYPLLTQEAAGTEHLEHRQTAPYLFYATLRDTLEQGIGEGIFDSRIRADTVAHTIIFLFSFVVENAGRVKGKPDLSPYIIDEMRSIFEIMLRGIIRDGIDRSMVLLPGKEPPEA